jgi:Flp pilus assembly protein TadD
VRETSVLINLGALLAQAQRFEQAEVALQEAAELARLAGMREQRVYILTNLGALANDRGDRSAAKAIFVEALGLARELGDPAPIGILERNLAALRRED